MMSMRSCGQTGTKDRMKPNFFVLFYFTFFFLFFVDCTGLFSIVCSVHKLEKIKKHFCCYCIFVCCFIFELKLL